MAPIEHETTRASEGESRFVVQWFVVAFWASETRQDVDAGDWRGLECRLVCRCSTAAISFG